VTMDALVLLDLPLVPVELEAVEVFLTGPAEPRAVGGCGCDATSFGQARMDATIVAPRSGSNGGLMDLDANACRVAWILGHRGKALTAGVEDDAMLATSDTGPVD
jgi:hypothetical protein